MAWVYRLGLWRRLVNRLIGILLRLGVSPPHTYLLTVRGRKSGQPYSTPVTLVEDAGKRWLVAPYGEVGWVRNARAAEQVTLSRRRRFETVRIQELWAEDAAPVLKKYLAQVPVVRPFFDVTHKSTLQDFAAEGPEIQYSVSNSIFTVDPELIALTRRAGAALWWFLYTTQFKQRIQLDLECSAFPKDFGGRRILELRFILENKGFIEHRIYDLEAPDKTDLERRTRIISKRLHCSSNVDLRIALLSFSL